MNRMLTAGGRVYTGGGSRGCPHCWGYLGAAGRREFWTAHRMISAVFRSAVVLHILLAWVYWPRGLRFSTIETRAGIAQSCRPAGRELGAGRCNGHRCCLVSSPHETCTALHNGGIERVEL